MRNQYSRGIRFSSGVLQLALILMYFGGPNQSAPFAQAENIADSKSGEAVKEEAKIDHIGRYVPNEVLVRYTKTGALGKITNRHGNLSKIKDIKSQKAGLLSIKDNKDIKEVIQDLRSDPDVIYAQPNYQYQPADLGTDDTLKGDLWGLDNTGQTVDGTAGTADADIDAPEAWAISTGSSVTVAVIDTGVAYNHPDLAANMWNGSSCLDENGAAMGACVHGYDFESSDKDPKPNDSSVGMSLASHGTHVAGIIAAVRNNGNGIAGVAPQAKIMALKSSLTTEELVRAISFAEYNGAKIINASWGGSGDDPLLDEAISNFNGVFVASAGNQASDNDETGEGLYPCSASLDNIICVAAMDQNDSLAYFSNYGVNSVDIGAPGVDILSTVADETASAENFNSATPPALPAGFTATLGTPGTLNSGGAISLIGDVSQSPYSDNADNIAASPAIDMTDRSFATLDFDTTCDTEYSSLDWTDYMKLIVSRNGSTYSDVGRWDEYMIDEDSDASGSSSYSFEGISLPSDELGTSTFHYAFEWITNGTDNNHAGCSVDNVVLKTIGSGAGNQYDFNSGTSMAAPMVAGTAALAWGYNSNLRQSDIVDAVVNHGDAIPELDGIIASGMRLNGANTLSYLRTAKSITSFGVTISATTYDGIINDVDDTIEIALPPATDLSTLSPVITQTGQSVNPASGASQDFSDPVTYTVTALDSSTRDYLVTARHLSTEKAITGFSFASPAVTGDINETDHTVSVEVPFGTNVTSLIPTIDYTGVDMTPGTGVAQDFTDPVVYTVEAEDGSSQTYTVTVTSRPDPFSNTGVSTSGVTSGKTSDTKVKLKFKHIDNAQSYKVSKNSSFDGAEWKPIKDGITVTLKKKSGKQKFYVKFLSEDSVESPVYTKSVSYEQKSNRTIKNSPSKVAQGGTLVQSGKRFTKNNAVKVFFSKPGGGYYNPIFVNTDSKGSFSVSYKVDKPAGTYHWYAVDGKTGKRSKIISYKVK